MIDIELLLDDLILYSPTRPALLPADASDMALLEADAFQLEGMESRPRLKSFGSSRKNKHIRKGARRRGS